MMVVRFVIVLTPKTIRPPPLFDPHERELEDLVRGVADDGLRGRPP